MLQQYCTYSPIRFRHRKLVRLWLGLGKGQVWFKIPVFGHRRQGWRLESQPDMWPLSCNSITNPSSLWYDSRWKKPKMNVM